MSRDQLPESLTRLVTPRAVRVHAEALGWRRVEGVNGEIAVYRNPDAPLRQLIVPLDEQLDDYGMRTQEAIERLAEFEKRPAGEILNRLLLPPADILWFREVSPEAEAGDVPLDRAVRMIDGVRKLLLSGAHGVLAPRRHHPRMSRTEAGDFLSRCRLGQTERGSFVLTVACPLDLRADLFGPTSKPFARQVTALLMTTLEELIQAADHGTMDDLADTERHPGISANLCESLLLLRPNGDRSRLDVALSWSSSLPPEGREAGPRVQLREEVFEFVEALAPRLRTPPEPRIGRFFGFVDELRGQPSQDDDHPSGEVRFTLFDQGEELRAKADLNPRDYTLAAKAHLATAVVRFKGVMERLPRLNRIRDLSDFAIIDAEDDATAENARAGRA